MLNDFNGPTMQPITHALLLELGFVELPAQPQRYAYKGITGCLEPDHNLFYFHGLSAPLIWVSDLRFMMMLIDYQEDEKLSSYPSHLN